MREGGEREGGRERDCNYERGKKGNFNKKVQKDIAVCGVTALPPPLK